MRFCCVYDCAATDVAWIMRRSRNGIWKMHLIKSNDFILRVIGFSWHIQWCLCPASELGFECPPQEIGGKGERC
jgi:hypothetical protein